MAETIDIQRAGANLRNLKAADAPAQTLGDDVILREMARMANAIRAGKSRMMVGMEAMGACRVAYHHLGASAKSYKDALDLIAVASGEQE